MVLSMPEETSLTGGFISSSLTKSWLAKDKTPVKPSDEQLVWLIQGKWAFSPDKNNKEHWDSNLKVHRYEGLVILHVNGTDNAMAPETTCQIQSLDGSKNPEIEWCKWTVKDHQLRIELPESHRTKYNEKYTDASSNDGTPTTFDKAILTKDVDFPRLKWTYQHEKLLEGQWGWASKDRVFNSYIVFNENQTCIFKDALNTTIHKTRECSWGIEKDTAQLTLSMDDEFKQGSFANPDAW